MISHKHRNYCYVIYDSTDRDIFDRRLDIFQIKGGSFQCTDEMEERALISTDTRMFGEFTLKEVADYFRVTPERIRQIEGKALRKLKHPSRSVLLRSFMYD